MRGKKRKQKIIKKSVDSCCLLWYIYSMNKKQVIAEILQKFCEIYPADDLTISVGTCRKGADGTFMEPSYRMVKKGLADPGIRTYFPPKIVIDGNCRSRDFVATVEHELGHYVEYLRGAREKTGYSEAFADSFVGKIA